MSLYNIRYINIASRPYQRIQISLRMIFRSINQKGLRYLSAKPDLMTTLVWILQGM